ncbi:hypothetical protein [Bradyrhizobium sp. AUGA SZCCT0160]|uniref:hypothetical protein n=1 Tax=Bradyrhizobium sp. AUGA SZCCT0160 TaxID=2807662 RepID=UPI001BA80AB6|nr:hypothetical protein [Bradyrhizobium sp. AUGA SZCCT0160]MBR1189961.1 hypothetical protein [Bradyrhizobium sp. AUGA SZCCT0160]
MPKPSLQLIHCSNDIRPGAKRRQDSTNSNFQPYVIPGGARSVPIDRSWEAALDLVDFGVLVCYQNYLAFLEASAAVLGGCRWTDHEETR